MQAILEVFTPNATVSKSKNAFIIATWTIAVLAVWSLQPPEVFPSPGAVWAGFVKLCRQDGLLYELGQSYWTNLQVLFWTTLSCLALAYATAFPIMRPLVAALSKLRMWSFTGLGIVFTLMIKSDHGLKMGVLIFFMGVFYLTSMATVVLTVPADKLEYGRTLKLNEFQVLWHVIIRQTRNEAIDLLRQNAAISFMMLATAEMMAQSEGGVGVLLHRRERTGPLAEVIAILILYGLVAIVQDLAIDGFRRAACRYAEVRKAGR